jgi:hypothetical protein
MWRGGRANTQSHIGRVVNPRPYERPAINGADNTKWLGAARETAMEIKSERCQARAFVDLLPSLNLICAANGGFFVFNRQHHLALPHR